MRITVETIPHRRQKYDTVGDWWWKFKNYVGIGRLSSFLAFNEVPEEELELELRISDMGDWRLEALVAVHELCEAIMCRHNAVDAQAVDDFDRAFEASRPAGNEDEPGDHPDAPYRRQHFVATTIERALARELGVDWDKYNDAVMALDYPEQAPPCSVEESDERHDSCC